MSQKPFLSVVIPAYNESRRLPLTLLDLDRHLSEEKYTYEIIVVNDGSKDDTAEIVKKFISFVPNLRLIDQKNTGKGGAVKHGMMEAKGRYRLFMDSDNSTSIEHFDKMLPLFEEGYDVVICSRAHKESKLTPAQPITRQIPGRMGNLFIQMLVLPGIWDTQCGFKAFSEKTAQEVFKAQKLTGWGFDVEILAVAKQLGFKIGQIPVTWVNDLDSRVGMSAYIQVLIDTMKIRYWLWRNIYRLR